MHIKTALRIYIIGFFTLLALSAVFLVKDIRAGKFLAEKLHFFEASFVYGKKPCNEVKTDDCIPDPISVILDANKNAQAADTTLHAAEPEDTKTEPSAEVTNPRFSNN